MSRVYRLFVPEYVPIENKGEEAIVRGMADVIFPRGNVEFHFLDMMATRPYTRDGFHIYPGEWFYSRWRSQGFQLRFARRAVYGSCCSLLRHGLNWFLPSWVRIPHGPVRRVSRDIAKVRSGPPTPKNERLDALGRIASCDYMVAGHDGAFNEYDCHVIDMMYGQGMVFGIFGTTMKVKVRSRAILSLFEKTLSNAEFVYCRNPIATDWARSHFPSLTIEEAPDPAFGMRPAPSERVAEIIEAQGLEPVFEKAVVMITSAEPAPIARYGFSGQGWRGRRLDRHHALIATLIEHIIDRYDANILFLPHCLGPTADLDDRRVAAQIVSKIKQPGDRVRILEADLSARDLKGLIGRADFLIAERIHSVIGAVGVHTPFLCLGVMEDIRMRGIVADMCRSEDAVYHLNSATAAGLLDRFDQVWLRRDDIRFHLERVSRGLETRLHEVGNVIRGRIIRGAHDS